MNKKLVGGAGALALALATPLIGSWEGKKNDPYKDIVGIPTVCYGETRVEMKRYTDAECLAMLQKAVSQFQWEVYVCTPQLKDRPYQLAAATSLAYNIGSKAYCKSTAAKLFRDKKFEEGCKAFMKYKYAGGKVTRGLINRRADEVKLCLTDLKATS